MNEYLIRFRVKVWSHDRLHDITDTQALIAYGATPVKAWLSVVASEAMRDRCAWKVMEIREQRSELEPTDVLGEVREVPVEGGL
jgi:hypothetical protein